MAVQLNWYLVSCLSLVLTGAGAYAYGEQVIATDRTFITVGIVGLYLVMTAWLGWAAHFGKALPTGWASYAVGLMPALGLIGTLIGIVSLFGLGSEAADLSNNAEVLAGLGTAIYTTLAGLVYSEMLFLQLRVLGDE